MLTLSDQENVRLYSEKTISGPTTSPTNNEYTNNLKDVLRSWLNDETIQYSRDSDIDSNVGWRDYDESDFNILSFLHYYNWRIKPEIQVYRLAVVNYYSLGVQVVAVNDRYTATTIETAENFVRWISEWIEWDDGEKL